MDRPKTGAFFKLQIISTIREWHGLWLYVEMVYAQINNKTEKIT
jgi:hypothetical protein